MSEAHVHGPRQTAGPTALSTVGPAVADGAETHHFRVLPVIPQVVALQVVTLRLAVTQVLLVGALRGLQLGDARDRDVPPARPGRVGAVEVGLDVDHRGTVGGLGLAVGLLELLDGVDLEDVQPPGAGVWRRCRRRR